MFHHPLKFILISSLILLCFIRINFSGISEFELIKLSEALYSGQFPWIIWLTKLYKLANTWSIMPIQALSVGLLWSLSNRFFKALFQQTYDSSGLLLMSSLLLSINTQLFLLPILWVVSLFLFYFSEFIQWQKKGQKAHYWLKGAYPELIKMGLCIGLSFWLWFPFAPIIIIATSLIFMVACNPFGVRAWASRPLILSTIVGLIPLLFCFTYIRLPMLAFGLDIGRYFFMGLIPIGFFIIPILLEKDLWIVLFRRQQKPLMYCGIITLTTILIGLVQSTWVGLSITASLSSLIFLLIAYELILISRHSKVSNRLKLVQYLIIALLFFILIGLLLMGLELAPEEVKYQVPLIISLCILGLLLCGLTINMPLLQWTERIVAPSIITIELITVLICAPWLLGESASKTIENQSTLEQPNLTIVDCTHSSDVTKLYSNIVHQENIYPCIALTHNLSRNFILLSTETFYYRLPQRYKNKMVHLKTLRVWKEDLDTLKLIKATKHEGQGYHSISRSIIISAYHPQLPSEDTDDPIEESH